jgi:hypothetical protein
VDRRHFLLTSLALAGADTIHQAMGWAEPSAPRRGPSRDYRFNKYISRDVLESYLLRAITMEGLLNGRGDFHDDIRMLKSLGAKYIGRSLCLWAQEESLIQRVEAAKAQLPQLHAVDPEMILEACIFEIVTEQVGQVPVPQWVFEAFGLPAEKRNFRYEDIAYAEGRRRDQWKRGASVPDVSRLETKLWFYFLARMYIDLGFEGIHFGQVEIMAENDPQLTHWSQVFAMVRDYATRFARRRMVLCNGHVPSGGLVRGGHLLLDFHAFPLRVMEVPGKPQEGVLKVGFADSIFGRSKGGITYSGWSCEHLPYLVELDNYGVSSTPGQAGAGRYWVWGYDEISWFANQSRAYRSAWLNYAWKWVRENDPNGFLEMPGSRTETSPLNHRGWYFANVPSAAVPDGLGDEIAIQKIWSRDSFS